MSVRPPVEPVQSAGSLPRRSLAATWGVPLVLIAIVAAGFAVRWAERDHFARHPLYWGVTAAHLAQSRALEDGHPFATSTADADAADRFLHGPGAFTRPLAGFDRMADSLRVVRGGPVYERGWADQSGWGAFVFLGRHVPGVRSLADLALLQILLDLGALLLLYPIGRFVTGNRAVALAGCALYALYLPGAYSVAEPFRDGWPALAVIYATGLALPAWRRGPAASLRTAGWLAASGAVAGVAVYVRTTAVLVPVVLALATVVLWRRRPRIALAAAAIPAAAMLVVLAPWMTFTARSAGVVSPTSSGRGHSWLTGLAEEGTNPLGLRFSDRFTVDYVTRVCGYPVAYGTFPYSAACRREAAAFIDDHRSWHRRLVLARFARAVVPGDAVRLRWGTGSGHALAGRVERWLPLAGLLGLVLGLWIFPRAWIPLLWLLAFWLSILPMQTHPRLFLGVAWTLLLGTAMLLAAAVIVPRRLRGLGRRAPALPEATAPPTRGFRLAAAGALAVDVLAAALILAFPARAPAPAHDWRRDLASADPAVRLAAVDSAAARGREGLPVLLAAERNDLAAVRDRAQGARPALDILVARTDFSDGILPAARPYPGVRLAVVPDPAAEGGYVLRARAPLDAFTPLYGFTWKPEPGQDYWIKVRGRFDHPLEFTVLTADLSAVRMVAPVATRDMTPMRAFRTAEIPFTSRLDDPAVALLFRQTAAEPGGPGTLTADFDWIEIWKER